MTAFLGGILGKLLKFVYDMVSTIGAEPENLSFYAIAIIITTIIFKLLLLPINLQQAKSTKKMGELQPQMKEIQTKYKEAYDYYQIAKEVSTDRDLNLQINEIQKLLLEKMEMPRLKQVIITIQHLDV